MIQTLLGPVPPEDLGWTYVHEHVLTSPPAWRVEADPDFVLDSPEWSLAEIESFQRAGGRTVVDATARDWGRDAGAVLEIARETAVNIVSVTGWNRGDYGEEALLATEDDLVAIMLGDLHEGMDGTGARAGIAKLGTSDGVVLAVEARIARAVGRVQAQTGCPVITHTTRGTMASEQLDLLGSVGADLSRVALSHMDQNLDFGLLEELCGRGASVIFDGCSKTKYAPDSARIAMLARLVEAGHAERVLVSGDMGRRSYLPAYGGGPGFRYILEEFVPRLRAEGFPEDLVETIFVSNPARWLDWPAS